MEEAKPFLMKSGILLNADRLLREIMIFYVFAAAFTDFNLISDNRKSHKWKT